MIYLIGIDTFMNILLNNLNIMQISINLWKLSIKKNGKRDLVKEALHSSSFLKNGVI